MTKWSRDSLIEAVGELERLRAADAEGHPYAAQAHQRLLYRLGPYTEELAQLAAEAREALRPFAELPDGLVGYPHPCIERCWRVGGPTRIRDGACEECGLQDRRPDGEQQVVVRYGDVRRARDVLGKRGGRDEMLEALRPFAYCVGDDGVVRGEPQDEDYRRARDVLGKGAGDG